MNLRALFVTFLSSLLSLGYADAQRTYSPHSVLATGNWYRIGIKQEGIYRVDVAMLSSLGIPSAGLSSGSIRLYGNGGGMLNENNAAGRPDDLVENPIEIVDGGDGSFNGSDYFLFYAPGPHRWLKDSVNQRFRHQKNLYSDTAFYYITIGGTGRRIGTNPTATNPGFSVNSYNDRYFYENDLINLLNSGKEWYGEEFNANLGGSLSKTFTVDWPGLQSQPVTLITDFVGRSVGANSSFSIKLNNLSVQTATVQSVSGYFLDLFASPVSQTSSTGNLQSPLSVGITWNPGPASAQGWLNWFELHGRRALAVTNNSPLFFRDWSTVKPASVARFTISNATAGMSVWEITDPANPSRLVTNLTGSQLSFDNDASRLREYVAFGSGNLPSPFALGKVANQDLHGLGNAAMLIVTESSLMTQAQRLQQFHQQHDGYSTTVVTTSQIFNEFSSGIPDPVAIRDFVKMFYDRSAGNQRPKYLLLMGTASYDYRNRVPGNVNLVPGFETTNSLEPLNTYTSDDFFGSLDDTDDINQNNASMLLDIGIGRIPARNIAEATMMVDKILRYHSSQSLGAWRNQTVYVADDQDNNLHLQDAEIIAASAKASNNIYNQYKIYLDAYPLMSGSGGARYPAVNDAIVNQVFNGALIFNYSGHGSYQRLAEEAVVTQEELNRFNNPDRLALFITASCDFAPHDDPAKNSLGAGILTGSNNGAIALLTTTRVVFAYSNRQINDNYLRIALQPDGSGKYLTLGESVMQAKNYTMQSTGDVVNNRKFALLGDPAMRLGFPDLRTKLNTVNGQLVGTDTLRALGRYEFTGTITDAKGNPQTTFNGKLNAVVFDKAQQVKTLGNDPASPVTSFIQQAGVLYKGDVTVKDGQFRFTFIVPKDINYQPGTGRISLYADDGKVAANGVNTDLYIGGQAASSAADNVGPVIKPFINDDKFLDGGLSNENPVLLVKLYDSSGISTSGNGIGHDITAVIDGNERNVLVLNSFYSAVQDSYQQGQVLYQLPLMPDGEHTIRIKAWDVANNSSEVTIRFVVAKQVKLQVMQVRNFPNPFTTSTVFGFEHNQPGKDLDVTIEIYTRSGARVKTIRQRVNTGGSRNCQINWNGDNQAGAKLAKGVYIYRVIVAAGDQETRATQQLIIF